MAIMLWLQPFPCFIMAHGEKSEGVTDGQRAVAEQHDARFSRNGHFVGAKAAAKRVSEGLLALRKSGTEGFVARNFVGKARVHYAIGSNDQTFPWFYGLWRYCRMDLQKLAGKYWCGNAKQTIAPWAEIAFVAFRLKGLG